MDSWQRVYQIIKSHFPHCLYLLANNFFSHTNFIWLFENKQTFLYLSRLKGQVPDIKSSLDIVKHLQVKKVNQFPFLIINHLLILTPLYFFYIIRGGGIRKMCLSFIIFQLTTFKLPLLLVLYCLYIHLWLYAILFLSCLF